MSAHIRTTPWTLTVTARLEYGVSASHLQAVCIALTGAQQSQYPPDALQSGSSELARPVLQHDWLSKNDTRTMLSLVLQKDLPLNQPQRGEKLAIDLCTGHLGEQFGRERITEGRYVQPGSDDLWARGVHPALRPDERGTRTYPREWDLREYLRRNVVMSLCSLRPLTSNEKLSA